ncbi:glycosyltransferase family 2 protein [Mucilaginibacter sp. RCC_168]|uniref:glycosyltransferase family 2 protein n=1 Tax=Mucilaginibacter sp. RCC_168 TaxID=3239221 RepID=UPI003526785B
MTQAKISVITPSYNQGRFIEQTILSVIGQQYTNLEYIIIDGGSSDETLDMIRKYEKHITYWVSEKDTGQSNAINKGFAQATGDILCWLNSDDYYLPGALLEVNRALSNERAELLFGNCIHLNEATHLVHGSSFDPLKNWDIKHGDYIVQPSSFWTRKAFEKTGKLREDLHFGFDWEWFARAQTSGVNFIPSEKYFSVYRLHNDQKSNDNNVDRFKELLLIERELNPSKFEFIDHYLNNHLNGINQIYNISAKQPFKLLEYRLLKTFHPTLIKLIDRVSLKKYIEYVYQRQK